MIDQHTRLHETSYTSSNMQKHISGNPLQRWLLDRFHATAVELMVDVRATTVLDAGCGEGFGMRAVLGESTRAVGLDYSAAAARLARAQNTAALFASGDVTRLPFADNTFDLVLCMEVLEHLVSPEIGLAELCRVSQRWLLLSVPNEPLFRGANFLRGKNMQAWGNDPGHLNHWSSRGFERFVGQQCQIVQVRRSFPWTLLLCRVR